MLSAPSVSRALCVFSLVGGLQEGRALGEVTKFRVYNLRRYQAGGDRPETYFAMTKQIAGVVDARAQELMPDVLHWLGIQSIDTLLSMSKDKYEAITKSGGIHVGRRDSLPETMVPAGAHTEISAKISSGYLGFQPGKTDNDAARRAVFTLESVRERCHKMLQLATADKLEYFEVDMTRVDSVASTVVDCMRRHHPELNIPAHSRMRHFEVNGYDRVGELESRWKRFHIDALERTRREIDLIVVSVLLDAGAGPAWKYTDHGGGGRPVTRSEGLALASLDMFRNALFSSAKNNAQRVDSFGLRALRLDDLERGFQVSESNELVGLRGRYNMLQRLANALENHPEIFGSPQGLFRPGYLVDYILKHAYSRTQRVSIRVLWQALMDSMISVFPDGSQLGFGDAYRYPRLTGAPVRSVFEEAPTDFSEVVPFHKLAQWMAYSLVEPLSDLGVQFVDTWLLTGLAEYRNGGLFIDTKLVKPRNPHYVLTGVFNVDSPVVVEWRALTVALLDKTAISVWDRLGMTERELPMSKILEGGTWRAGRELAFQLRENGTPPITVDSKGDVF